MNDYSLPSLMYLPLIKTRISPPLQWSLATPRHVVALNTCNTLNVGTGGEKSMHDHMTFIKVKKEVNKELIYSWLCHASDMKWCHELSQMLLNVKFLSAYSILYTNTNWLLSRDISTQQTSLYKTWLVVNNVSYLMYSQMHHLFKCWNMNISLWTIDPRINKMDWITDLTLPRLP